jgi:DNA mismatch repair protein MutL
MMPVIEVLPSAVADQIAAGEVVERPASVVKELVENALDAGATAIEVDVRDGGTTEIRVSDDGHGIRPDQAALALSRHATSKIRNAEDLVGVASFGFRGEALPAICSVAQLSLLTSTADGEGTLVRASGGVVEGQEPATRRRGTTVTVSNLFYNTPARRKFLRSARSEWRAIADSLVTTSLVRRDVRFRITSDGREAFSLAPAAALRERVAAIWGADYADRFLDVDAVSGVLHVEGLVERPSEVGTGSRRAMLVVNGRPVRDAGMTRAVEAAYRSTLPSGVRPSFILALTLPASDLDVNVHPAKAEVRFHQRWPTERALEGVVQRALGSGESAAWLGRIWTPGRSDESPGRPLDALPMVNHTLPADGLFQQNEATTEDTTAITPTQLEIPPLIQLRRTYLLYEHEQGVVLIDQHSAHERILYERFLSALSSGGATAQRLLFPETVHLSPAEADAFDANADLWSRLGYDMEAFGGHSLIVNAVPTPHPRFDAIRCLRDTLATLAGARVASAHARHEQLAATVGCKAAIKSGDLLSREEMRALFRDLATTTLPAHDVHGRSTIVQLSWDEVDRRFGRR